MQNLLIKGATIVNEGQELVLDVFIKNGLIDQIATSISPEGNFVEIDGSGKFLFPGCIDDQVHFREPGLTHKANIATEAKAALAGGVTSFMEMPNTNPTATTQALLADKYAIAANCSVANYSFFMGTTNDNADEVLRTNPAEVCGIKIFMGSSTGNMLVDSESTLSRIFCNTPMLIATHCEDEPSVKANLAKYQAIYGDDIPAELHPIIRDEDACYLSSSKAIEIARKCGTRLHVLHITTAKELELFSKAALDTNKKITSEVCVHHLWYTANDYKRLGNLIKCNPAIKAPFNRAAIRQALVDGVIDVVATDHAPHTWDEKQQVYTKSPAGLPLVQHSLQLMLTIADQEGWSKAFVAEKMAHNPAKLFAIRQRGYIREGYWADLVLVAARPYTVQKNQLLYKCQWSPLEGETFPYTIDTTIVNGQIAYQDGTIVTDKIGQRMMFDRI